MLNFLTILSLGFILGLQHATEADHVAAVSTIVSQTKNLKKSLLTGAFWGLGHTATLFVIGFTLLALKLTIPPIVSNFFELGIGVMLAFLGIETLISLRKNESFPHVHYHEHDQNHQHLHVHQHKYHHSQEHLHHHKKSIILGMFHGLAGSGALVVLVISSVDSLWYGLILILIFGLGSIIGMSLVSTLIGLPFILLKGSSSLTKAIQAITGLISILVGITLVYEMGNALLVAI